MEKERQVKMNSLYTHIYTTYGAKQYHCGHMTKFSSRGVIFPYRSKRSKRITQKKKLHTNVCLCVCVGVHIGSVDVRQLYIAVIYLHPHTKLFSGSPIVGRPQGCTFPQELYKCNGSNFCVDSTTHTFYCPLAI